MSMDVCSQSYTTYLSVDHLLKFVRCEEAWPQPIEDQRVNLLREMD